MTERSHTTLRWIALAALVAVGVALGAMLLLRDDEYVLKARFHDAGGLVKGGVVSVAGAQVGTIRSIELSDDGTATVKMAITEGTHTPLSRGVHATIRAVGLAGLTNRFVALTPPPVAGDPIPDGGTLSLSETSGIVDVDTFLSAFDADTRKSVQQLVLRSGEIFAGSGSQHFNGMLAQASPALKELSGVTGELASDEAQLERLISTSAATAGALAERPGEIDGAIQQTARALGAVNDERAAFSEDIERLPGVLRAATHTLGELRVALPEVRQTLRRVPAAAAPLTSVLRHTAPATRRLEPVVNELRGLLPALTSSLRGLPALERVASPALRNAGEGLNAAIPMLAALRVYTPDLVLGVFGGLGGVSSASYDALGHYGRLLIATSPQASTAGFASIFKLPPLGPLGLRTGLTAPCPGAAAEPAPDGSNVWVPDPDLCDPGHGKQ